MPSAEILSVPEIQVLESVDISSSPLDATPRSLSEVNLVSPSISDSPRSLPTPNQDADAKVGQRALEIRLNKESGDDSRRPQSRGSRSDASGKSVSQTAGKTVRSSSLGIVIAEESPRSFLSNGRRESLNSEQSRPITRSVSAGRVRPASPSTITPSTTTDVARNLHAVGKHILRLEVCQAATPKPLKSLQNGSLTPGRLSSDHDFAMSRFITAFQSKDKSDVRSEAAKLSSELRGSYRPPSAHVFRELGKAPKPFVTAVHSENAYNLRTRAARDAGTLNGRYLPPVSFTDLLRESEVVVEPGKIRPRPSMRAVTPFRRHFRQTRPTDLSNMGLQISSGPVLNSWSEFVLMTPGRGD